VRPATAASRLLIADFEFNDTKPLDEPGASANGPSFDCTRAAQPAERLICNDAALSSLDRRLAAVHADALKHCERDGVAAIQRSTQRDSHTNRTACATAKNTRSCLVDSYQLRPACVQITGGLLVALTPVNLVCAGREHESLLAVYQAARPARRRTRI
jgi:hypothetical protein